jgi:DNA-binding MarR family transcriptional regulator
VDELRSKPGHLIWRAQQLGWQLFAEEAGELNITPVQEVVLLALQKNPNIDQKTLASLVASDRSTIGDVVGRLEARGLVERSAHKDDRRAWSISLTPTGSNLATELVPIAKRAADRFLSPLTLRERSEFLRLMRKISGIADQMDNIELSVPDATRFENRAVLVLGDDPTAKAIAKRCSAEGAKVVELDLKGKDQATNIDRALKVIVRSNKIDSIIISDWGTLKDGINGKHPIVLNGEIEARQKIFRAIEKLQKPVRIVALGLFPRATFHSELFQAIAITNDVLAASAHRFGVSLSKFGITINSLRPVELANRPGSSATIPLAIVSDADIAACASLLLSNDARAISGCDLELGHNMLR